MAQLVAERGNSCSQEREKVCREDADEADVDYWNDTIMGVNNFSRYTGFKLSQVDPAEIDFEFVEQLRFVFDEYCGERSKPILPGILMCKVADRCIDEQRKANLPVIPIPTDFFEHKSELRRMEIESETK